MIDPKASIAAIRFGFGLSKTYEGKGSPAALIAELNSAEFVPPQLTTLSSEERLKRDQETRRERLAPDADGKRPDEQQRRKIIGQIVRGQLRDYIDDAHRRVMASVASPTPFFERLVDFWSNHFTVSVKNGTVRILAGTFDIEAIRPNVMGSFVDLLVAAEMHPAMFAYLDQSASIGPNSPAGEKLGKGLNENLAREIMELHTLGVHGGYTQSDVRSFALLMTGWTVPRNLGRIRYVPRVAEPGSKMLLGRQFSAGQSDFADALRMLAQHPATAQMIATKLVRHFMSPNPPEDAVKTLADVFVRTNGFLPDVYRQLVSLPGAWAPIGSNVKNHYQFVVSALRAVDINPQELAADMSTPRPRTNPLSLGALADMNQQPWTAPSPAGWPEDPEDWLTPSGLAKRLNWVEQLIPHIADDKPADFLERVLGPVASKRTRDVIAAASNREEGLALVLASPEFNRR